MQDIMSKKWMGNSIRLRYLLSWNEYCLQFCSMIMYSLGRLSEWIARFKIKFPARKYLQSNQNVFSFTNQSELVSTRFQQLDGTDHNFHQLPLKILSDTDTTNVSDQSLSDTWISSSTVEEDQHLPYNWTFNPSDKDTDSILQPSVDNVHHRSHA